MTIATTESRISYNGNGVTTIFAFPYLFLANEDMVVVLVDAVGVETTQIITTNYTLTGAGDDQGGTITMLVPPGVGEKIVIYRSTEIVQEVDYITGDRFPAETHERALDRLTVIAQEQQDQLNRAAVLPVTSTLDPEDLVRDIVRLADSADNIDTVVNNVGSVNTVATDIANVNTVSGSIANVNAVGSNIGNVLSVDANAANINTVSGSITNVNTVATNITNVNTVATNIGNINTVATNIADVNLVADNIVVIQQSPANAALAQDAVNYLSTYINEIFLNVNFPLDLGLILDPVLYNQFDLGTL